MKNILITGGAGFIGSHLAIELVKRGYIVTVLDNLSPQIHGSNPEKSPLYRSTKDKVRFIHGSVTSRDDWKNSIIGQDAIIHYAAETGTGQSMYEIEKYVQVNIGGTALLLDVLANSVHSIKKMIVASSRAVYGEGKYSCDKHGIVYPDERRDVDMAKGDFECKCPICFGNVSLLPTTEDSRLSPSSIYGITKQNQEQMVLVAGKSLGIPSVAFRYQNVYGPGQSLSNPYTGILSIFSTQMRGGKKINIFEDGKESRDFVYVSDVVDATILGLESEKADYQVFNVGANYPVDVMTVANTLQGNYNTDVKIEISGNYRLGDIRHNYADLTKIKNLLNFAPKVSFVEGLSRFCAWVEMQDVIESKYDESIKEMKQKGLYK